jgi:cytochrome c-type biogenesis protein CcmH
VILFYAIAALMAACCVWLIARPLIKRSTVSEAPGFAPRASVAVASVAVAIAIAGIYPFASNWHWQDAERAAAESQASGNALFERLERHLRSAPEDLDGWLTLGHLHASRQELYLAADAYEHAVHLSNGSNVEALLGLGESLAVADQTALNGRAGEMVERAVSLDPRNARALWWSGAAAYQRNQLALARTRWQQLLAGNPPPDIAQILTVKISEIDKRIGATTGGTTPQPAAPAAGARVRLKIELADNIKPGESAGALFVLARHAGESGPPLAVKRLALGSWPVQVELSEQDSMIPSRVLAVGDEVQVVARISRTGTAAPASGDRYGEVHYRVGSDGLVTLRIDKQIQ